MIKAEVKHQYPIIMGILSDIYEWTEKTNFDTDDYMPMVETYLATLDRYEPYMHEHRSGWYEYARLCSRFKMLSSGLPPRSGLGKLDNISYIRYYIEIIKKDLSVELNRLKSRRA